MEQAMFGASSGPEVELRMPDIEILLYRNSHVLGIRVYPSSSRPHYLRSDPVTGTYVRVGSANRRADEDLIAEMRRFSRGESFDKRPMPNLDSESIDFRAASESFAEIRKLSPSDLDALRLFIVYRGRRAPTVGGILLFGHDHLVHFPYAWIQAGRFAGTDKANIVDQTELRMPLVDAVIGLSPRATRTRLSKLVDRSLATEIGTGPQDPKRRYFKTKE